MFLHEKDIVLQFDDEAHFLDVVIISQDPWRLILDDVMLMRSSNSTLNNLDIWMTPEVCNAFLRSKDKHVKVYLSQIHKQCRDKDPDKRPNAGQLVKSYKDVQLKLQSSKCKCLHSLYLYVLLNHNVIVWQICKIICSVRIAQR